MKKLTLLTWSLQAALLFAAVPTLFSQQNTDVVVKKTFKDVNTNKNHDYNYTWKNENNNFSEHRDPCKVFIGVGTSSVENGGLKVTYTVDNTPATTYGVKEGDIILTLDGVKVNTQTELITERNKHQQGEAFTLTILRDGKEMKIDARFNACTPEEQEQAKEMKKAHANHMAEMEEHMAEMRAQLAEMNTALEGLSSEERPILGIYPGDENNTQGIVVGSVISGKGAEAAGLQEGDVIVNVDGKTTKGEGGIGAALAGHKRGDKVPVTYIRNGQTGQTEITLSADRSYVRNWVERDPCKVFIGVYTSDAAVDGKGVRVSGVIDNTPAKESSMSPGDVILTLDGAPVNTHLDLQRERDKHQPGDRFKMTVLRDGQTITVNATFKNCDKNGQADQKPVEEVVEMLNEETPDAAQRGQSDFVKLNVFRLSPNPTFGLLDVQFEAAAVPTTVNITDLSGKIVYSNSINQFSGFFGDQINLDGQAPGSYVLSIRQGEKVTTKKFVLLPKA